MNEYVPSMPKSLFRKIIKGFSAEMASAYPEVSRAYNALSQFLNQPNENLILSNGADGAMKMILETFCDPGAVIATIAPTFEMYKIHSQELNCKLIEVYCEDDGSCSDDTLAKLISPDVKVVLIANPNGATGYIFSVDRLREFVRKAEERDILVVIDEVYADFGRIDASPLVDEFSNVIIIRSFSKNVGLAGLRIGYILTNEGLAKMIGRFKPFREVTALAARAVEVVCTDGKYLKNSVNKILIARKKFAKELKKMGFDVIEGGGNFVLINFGSKRDTMLKAFENNNIEFKETPNPLTRYIRLTVGVNGIMKQVASIIRSELNSGL
ncbi:MAG TPA: histidinol-phosphate transaminase [Candidatus Moranbacteria bacterium]|nr:histidinol-phosphate transaminase [Candidatus Moranbacteria bacterium]